MSWGGPRGDLECRIAFGHAASMMNTLVLPAFGHLMVAALGESAPARSVTRLAETFLVVVLLPLPSVAFVLALITRRGRRIRDAAAAPPRRRLRPPDPESEP